MQKNAYDCRSDLIFMLTVYNLPFALLVIKQLHKFWDIYNRKFYTLSQNDVKNS